MMYSVESLFTDCDLISIIRVLDMPCFFFYSLQEGCFFSVHVQCYCEIYTNNVLIANSEMVKRRVPDSSSAPLPFAFDIELRNTPAEEKTIFDYEIEQVNLGLPIRSTAYNKFGKTGFEVSFVNNLRIIVIPAACQNEEQWRIVVKKSIEDENSIVQFIQYGHDLVME